MTPDEARRLWYQEMADEFAPQKRHMDERRAFTEYVIGFTAEELARLAAHFGRLALGQTQSFYIPSNEELAWWWLPKDIARAKP